MDNPIPFQYRRILWGSSVRPGSSRRSNGVINPSKPTHSFGGMGFQTNGGGVRIGTAMAGVPPGTALVPGSSMGRRPGTALQSANLKIAERPMTQQGLGGLKIGSQGPGRQVMDKSYFLGLLRQKSAELSSEIVRLQQEGEMYNRDNSQFHSYEVRVESLSAEIKAMQGDMADSNTLLDKLNTDMDITDIVRDKQQVAMRNQAESRLMDNVFKQRTDKESQIKRLEEEIEEQKQHSESLVASLPHDKSRQYHELTEHNQELLVQLEKKQQQLDTVSALVDQLQKDLSSDSAKQEAAQLTCKITELQIKHEQLEEEIKSYSKLSMPQERDRLLQQVKDDNHNIAGMERRITELRDKARQVSDQLDQINVDLEEQQGEKNQKYQELVKRDKDMQAFINSFPKARSVELENCAGIEENIMAILERISKNLHLTGQLPSQSEFKQMQSDLGFKQREMDYSKTTSEGLNAECRRLRSDAEKVDQLEGKIVAELKSIDLKMRRMNDEMSKFEDIDKLKEDADKKKKDIALEKNFLSKRRENFKGVIKARVGEYDKKKKTLNEHETYVQLCNMEQKLRNTEQSNFQLKEYIASKSAESDFHPAMEMVTDKVKSYNKILINSLSHVV